MTQRWFAKVIVREWDGRLRTYLENPPYRRFDEMPDSALIDLLDVARARAVSRMTVYNHVMRGTLRQHPKTGRGLYFRVSEVRRWIANVPLQGEPGFKKRSNTVNKSELLEENDKLVEVLEEVRAQVDDNSKAAEIIDGSGLIGDQYDDDDDDEDDEDEG